MSALALSRIVSSSEDRPCKLLSARRSSGTVPANELDLISKVRHPRDEDVEISPRPHDTSLQVGITLQFYLMC